VVLVLTQLPAALRPERYQRVASAFPRNEWAGWILCAVALSWTALIVLHAPLGRFEEWKPALYFVAPGAFVLMVFFLDELLAPRALGGLLLLVANPVLNIARWHPSNLRLVVTVVAYLLVVAGILLVLSPYRFRQATEWSCASRGRCRAVGTVGVALGTVLVVLGLTVY
jgi:hypothetical protein